MRIGEACNLLKLLNLRESMSKHHIPPPVKLHATYGFLLVFTSFSSHSFEFQGYEACTYFFLASFYDVTLPTIF